MGKGEVPESVSQGALEVVCRAGNIAAWTRTGAGCPENSCCSSTVCSPLCRPKGHGSHRRSSASRRGSSCEGHWSKGKSAQSTGTSSVCVAPSLCNCARVMSLSGPRECPECQVQAIQPKLLPEVADETNQLKWQEVPLLTPLSGGRVNKSEGAPDREKLPRGLAAKVCTWHSY